MYTIVVLLMLVISLLFFDKEKDSFFSKAYFCLFVLILIFLEGFRWNVGTDWRPYYKQFIYNYSSSFFEFGYVFFSQSIRSLTDNYTFFLLILAIIWYLALSNYIQQYSLNPIISLCVAYCSFLPYLGMNRQFLAMAITLSSIYFIFKRKLMIFIGLIICASFFHRTAVFFFPAYFLSNIELTRKQIILIFLGAYVVGFVGILNVLPLNDFASLFGEQVLIRYEHYLDIGNHLSIMKGTILRSFILILCMLVDVPEKHKKTYTYFFNMYFVSVLMYVLFQPSALNIISSRGGLYYSISSIVLVTFIIHFLCHDRVCKMACWIIFFGLYFYLMNKGINEYIEIVGFDIFRPYENVLFSDGII